MIWLTTLELIFTCILILYLSFLILELFNFIIREVPPISTSSRTIKFILEIIEKEEGKRETFIDLGCGMGKILIAVKKKYPQLKIIGYENWPTQFLLAKIMFFFSRTKGKILYKNLFQADLTAADIVFCYLSSEKMNVLEKKFEGELKNGVLVISNTFPLPHWKPRQIVTPYNKNSDYKKIFIYEKREAS